MTDPTHATHRDLAYVPGGHSRQVLDLHLPDEGGAPTVGSGGADGHEPGDAGARGFPVVLFIHGGAWRHGDKSASRALAWGRPHLLEAGFAVASMNYRFSHHATFPAQIHDAKAAVRWLRAHAAGYGLDPGRIGAWGTSSGGHLAALLGTSAGVPGLDGELGPDASTEVGAVVAWYPPTDFPAMDEQRLPDGSVHDDPDSPESRLLGGPLQERREAARAADPATYVDGSEPPFLLVHGDADRLVPWQQSVHLRDALDAAGSPVELEIVEGAGHGSHELASPERAEELVGFFRRHLMADDR